jgi:hypothetical protein
LLVRVAEVDAVAGALLRPGDTGFGAEDVPKVIGTIRGTRAALGENCVLRMRIDAAGDCEKLLEAVDRETTLFLTKAKMTPDLIGALSLHKSWRTVDVDAFGEPTRQVATIEFRRGRLGKTRPAGTRGRRAEPRARYRQADLPVEGPGVERAGVPDQ